MKLLFDQNISFRLVKRLNDLFPNCDQVRNLGLENASDVEIWQFAKNNCYTIVTFDSDFYEFSLIWGHPPKIIWLRVGNTTTNQIDQLLRSHVKNLLSFEDDDDLACLRIS
jgi:predicted nuclease of predicted toxin-antitoxin system